MHKSGVALQRTSTDLTACMVGLLLPLPHRRLFVSSFICMLANSITQKSYRLILVNFGESV